MNSSDNQSDPFALLRLQRKFDLDATTLAEAARRTGNDAAAAQIAEPRARAETLMSLLGGPTSAEYVGLPSGFADAVAQAHGDPAVIATLRSERWNNVAHLFTQLLAFDKAPTQIGRARMLRAELNAIDLLK